MKTVLKSSLSHMAKSDCAFLLLPSLHLISGGFKMLEYKEEGVRGSLYLLATSLEIMRQMLTETEQSGQ